MVTADCSVTVNPTAQSTTQTQSLSLTHLMTLSQSSNELYLPCKLSTDYSLCLSLKRDKLAAGNRVLQPCHTHLLLPTTQHVNSELTHTTGCKRASYHQPTVQCSRQTGPNTGQVGSGSFTAALRRWVMVIRL